MNDDEFVTETDEAYLKRVADNLGDASVPARDMDLALLDDLAASMTREDWGWLDIVRGLVRCPVHGQHCSLAEAVIVANANMPAVSR